MRKTFRAFVVFAIVALLLTACAGVDFTLTFQVDGKTYATVRTNGKDPVKMPKDPVKEGHVFDGWYWDKDVWEKPLTVNSFLDTPLTENLTVYAKWKVSDTHEHAYGDWETVSPATCAAEGLRKRVCSVCEEAETAAIEKLPHTYGDWTEISPATCSAEGRKTRACSVCSEAETAAIPKLSHTFQTKFDQAGHWRKCSVCGEEEEKQAHRYENGVCTVCGRIPGTEGLEYSKAAGGYTVRGIGTAAGTAIEIPSDYEGEPVIAIGVIAFYQNNKIESVTVPDSVTRINEFAFRECGNLKRVTIGNGVTTIGGGAFYDCGNLESVTVGSGVTIIESEAFLGCANLRSVNLSNGVTEIGNSAFAGCGNLQNIMIPEGVSKIGAAAFAGCGSLKSISIPKSVTNIANVAFRDCGGLETITVAEGNAKYFGAGNSIIETETKTLIYGCKNSVIPAGGSVTAIGDSAFEGCVGLKNILIPNGVKSIGSSAFEGCVGLKNIQIPNGVISIGSRAFWGSGLLGIEIPESVTSIDNFSFGDCGDLEMITVAEGNAKYFGAGNSVIETETKTLLFGCKTSVIPGDGSVTVIGGGAFFGCVGILSVIIPDSVVKIGFRAFSGCEGLTGITIPDSVTEIDYGAFDGCFNLKSVTFGSGVATIGPIAFRDCDIETITVSEGNAKYRSAGNSLINIGTKTLVLGCKNSVIPTDGSVTAIGDGAFEGCKGLQSIVIPDGVTYLGYEAFARCENLLSLTIGNGVTTIGDYAFRECSSLQSVAVPDSVASVGEGAFEFCKNLRSATFGRGVSSIGFGVLNGCAALETITVEEGNAAFYSVGNCIVERSTGTLVAGCKTSVIPNNGSVFKIGDGAFFNCGGLEAVMIPDSVTSIGYSAFAGCWGLKTLDLPNGIVSIGYGAFMGCWGLKTLDLPNGIVSIGYDAFSWCASLESIVIPDSVVEIGYGAFIGCFGLKSVSIGKGVTRFQTYTFSCYGLKTIEFRGTIAEWNEITKDADWDLESGDYTVICTDGTILKSDSKGNDSI